MAQIEETEIPRELILSNFLKELSTDERKKIENEMLFRRANEKIGTDLDVVDANHIADGNPHLVRSDDLLLFFKCECSDEKCQTRVKLKLSKYRLIHLERSTFVIRPGHEIKSIEKVIEQNPTYSIVRKNNVTPEPKPKAKFNKTDINKL
jgi:hypothetical protein